MTRRTAFGALVFVLSVVVAACNKTTPTEVPFRYVVPTATPVPVGQPAPLSGTVYSHGTLIPPTTVECQGKSATPAADGRYSLSDLLSGKTVAILTYS